MERPDVSLAVYNLYQYSQPTTASVERSFSMLRKLLAKARNFKVENVKQHDFTFQFLHLVIAELADYRRRGIASFVEDLHVFVN